MKKIILTALITSAAIITFYSFHTMKYIDGKIDIRGKGEVYIVNASPTKAYRFTVKKTTTTNDTLVTYSTDYVELSPGDEQGLGRIDSTSERDYPIIDSPIFKIYTKSNPPIYPPLKKNASDIDKAWYMALNDYRDTLIDGDSVKYKVDYKEAADWDHPLPISKFSYKYEVTGELEIKPNQIRE